MKPSFKIRELFPTCVLLLLGLGLGETLSIPRGHSPIKRSPIMDMLPNPWVIGRDMEDDTSIPSQDHAHMLQEVQRYSDFQLLPKDLFEFTQHQSSLSGYEPQNLGSPDETPPPTYDYGLFERAASSFYPFGGHRHAHRHFHHSIDREAALVEQLKMLGAANDDTENSVGSEPNGQEVNQENPPQTSPEDNSGVVGRGSDQHHHHRKQSFFVSSFPEELTNLKDPLADVFLVQPSNNQKHSKKPSTPTKTSHVVAISLDKSYQLQDKLPYDAPPPSPPPSYSPPDTYTLDYDPYDPTDNLEYHSSTTSTTPTPRRYPQFSMHNKNKSPASSYTQNTLILNKYPSTTSSPVSYDASEASAPAEEIYTQSPYPIYKDPPTPSFSQYRPQYNPQSPYQSSGASQSSAQDKLQDLLDDGYTKPPPTAYDIPEEAQYPPEEIDGSYDDTYPTTTSSPYEEEVTEDSYPKSEGYIDENGLSYESSNPDGEYPFLTEASYPPSSPEAYPYPPQEEYYVPIPSSSTTEPPYYPEPTTTYPEPLSPYEEEDDVSYPAPAPVPYYPPPSTTTTTTTTEKYSYPGNNDESLSKYFSPATYQGHGYTPVFSGSLSSYPTHSLVYPTKKPVTTTTTTTAKPYIAKPSYTTTTAKPSALNPHTKPLYISALQKALALQQMLRREGHPAHHAFGKPSSRTLEDETDQQSAPTPVITGYDRNRYSNFHYPSYQQVVQPGYFGGYENYPAIPSQAPHPHNVYQPQRQLIDDSGALQRSARRINEPLANRQHFRFSPQQRPRGSHIWRGPLNDHILTRTHRTKRSAEALIARRIHEYPPPPEEMTRFMVYSPKHKLEKYQLSYWIRWAAGFYPDSLKIKYVSKLPNIFADFTPNSGVGSKPPEVWKPDSFMSDEPRDTEFDEENEIVNGKSKRSSGDESENSITRVRKDISKSQPDTERRGSYVFHRFRKSKKIYTPKSKLVTFTISYDHGDTNPEKNDKPREDGSRNLDFFAKYDMSNPTSGVLNNTEIVSTTPNPITTTTQLPRKNVFGFRPQPRPPTTTTPKPMGSLAKKYIPAKETEVHKEESPASFVYLGAHHLLLPGLEEDSK